MSYLFILILFGLLAWYWQDSLRANETATRSAMQTCKGQQLQFLDGTVVLQSIRLFRNDAGHMCLKRTFQFEYSADRDNRKIGFVIMLGSQIEAVGLED